MTFNDTLENMLDTMNKYHRNKDSLLAYYINKRLNKSLETYYKDLSASVNYLSDKNSFKVMKSMNRE